MCRTNARGVVRNQSILCWGKRCCPRVSRESPQAAPPPRGCLGGASGAAAGAGGPTRGLVDLQLVQAVAVEVVVADERGGPAVHVHAVLPAVGDVVVLQRHPGPCGTTASGSGSGVVRVNPPPGAGRADWLGFAPTAI